MTTSVPWAQERTGGWIRQLQITPLRMWSVTVVKLVAAMLLVLPSLVIVSALAGITQNVSMPPWNWVALVAAMWLGALPFAAFGLVVGSLATPDSAQPIAALSTLAFALLGGLLLPLDALPNGLRGFGEALPSNAYGELGRRIAAGHLPAVGTVAQLVAWSAGLLLVAVVAFRRATVKP
jgi:ABC-2 type transport system permease protein